MESYPDMKKNSKKKWVVNLKDYPNFKMSINDDIYSNEQYNEIKGFSGRLIVIWQ